MLAHQLEVLPPLEQFWNELPDFFSWLHEDRTIPPLPAYQQGAEESVWNPGSVNRSTSGIVQKIQFAAANRVCIRLGYSGEVRLVEPYSFRTSREGAKLFYGFHREDDQMKCFRVDRFENVEITKLPFTPRYRIEISSAGYVTMPPVSIRTDNDDYPRPQSTRKTTTARRSTRTRPRVTTSSYGMSYTFECVVCKKRFRRSSYDGKLNRHKGNNGYECPGTIGVLVR